MITPASKLVLAEGKRDEYINNARHCTDKGKGVAFKLKKDPGGDNANRAFFIKSCFICKPSSGRMWCVADGELYRCPGVLDRFRIFL